MSAVLMAMIAVPHAESRKRIKVMWHSKLHRDASSGTVCAVAPILAAAMAGCYSRAAMLSGSVGVL